MQHHDAIRRHHEMGGAAEVQSRPSSLIDRLLRPMFSLGFSADAADESDSNNILGLKASTIQDDDEEEDSEAGASYKSFKKSSENPNSSCKMRENGATKFCSRGHWKPSEDAKLRELVAAYGPQNWNLIAERLEGRSGKSCRLRWYNQLDPKINKRAFTEEEEERLMEAHRVYGNKWAFISRLFPGRTDNSVKNHWHVLMARRSREKSKSKSKSYMKMKMKWASPSPSSKQQQPTLLHETTRFSSMQESAAYNYYGDPYSHDHFNHGNSYSPVSTSQISFAAPILSSTSAADYQYRDAAYNYMGSNETPAFIDFLGVGSR